MSRLKKSPWILALALIGAGLVIFQPRISNVLQNLTSSSPTTPEVGRFRDPIGEVEVKTQGSSVNQTPAERGFSLRHGDSVSTGSQAFVTLELQGGFSLRVESESLLVVERPTDELPVRLELTVLRGGYEVLERGQEGSLVVLKGQTRLDPLGRPAPATPFRVSGKESATISGGQSEVVPEPPSPAASRPQKPTAQISTPPSMPDTESAATPTTGTLPDDYIVSVVEAQKTYFNRCYADYLQKNPSGTGQVDISFKIEPEGKIAQIKILNSTLKDKKIEDCTVTVLERCLFRRFQGEAIIVNFPIVYE